jgi:hypothetical protein
MRPWAGTSQARAEAEMANDADWVADVRRWYFSTAQKPPVGAVRDESELDSLGYEAAHPALEARHWAETDSGVVSLK